jgi:hypothetical protein
VRLPQGLWTCHRPLLALISLGRCPLFTRKRSHRSGDGVPAFDLSVEDAEMAAAQRVDHTDDVRKTTPLIPFARMGELTLLERIVHRR